LTEVAAVDRKFGGAEGSAVSLHPQQMLRPPKAAESTTR
jgi:hypothetical protein